MNKKRIAVFLFFGVSCMWVFGNLLLEFSFKEAITPLDVLPIFLEVENGEQNSPQAEQARGALGVSADIHYVTARITLSNHHLIRTHEARYPIIRNIQGDAFFLVHFFWLLEVEDSTVLNIPRPDEEPQEFDYPIVTISIQYGKELKPYYELLRVDYDSQTKNRVVSYTITPSNATETNLIPRAKTAIIFIHGIQNGQYERLLTNYSDSVNDWKNPERKECWKNYYTTEGFDYYEYQFDSLFDTVKNYGETLAQLLEDSNFLNTYEKIYIISHSMGTLVARYAINTPLSDGKRTLGDECAKVFLIAGMLEGTYFANLNDYLVNFMDSTRNSQLLHPNVPPNELEEVYTLITSIYNYKALILNPQKVLEILNSIIATYTKFPLLFSTFLISFDDVPFIGGQAIPFQGMNSMRYTSKAFLTGLETGMGFTANSYLQNLSLKSLNENEKHKEKMVLITSYVKNSNEFFNKIINIAKFLQLEKALDSDTVSKLDVLSMPIAQFLLQRALSIAFENLASLANQKEHALNDGFVPFWSATLSGHPEGLPKENLLYFENLDHGQTKEDQRVIKAIFDGIPHP